MKVAEDGDPLAQLAVADLLREKNPKKAALYESRAASENVFSWEKTGDQRQQETLTKKVLIVDDDPKGAQLLGHICEDQGLDPMYANSGKIAFAMINKNPDIRLLFLDVVMEGMNGIQLLRMIRKIDLLPGVPIVVMSGYSPEKVISELRKFEITEFLLKPLQKQRISQILEGI